jgi:hypothetical protein
VAEGDGVGAHTEGWAPLFRNGLGETGHTSFGEGVVGLAGVAVNARGRGDVDDAARFAVLDAEVRSGIADEFEGCGSVKSEDGVPLLVGGLGEESVTSSDIMTCM